MKSDTRSIAVRVTPTEYGAIQNEIMKGAAINSSDYLRQALREKIAKTKTIEA